ncbi:SPBc2 prophage-derived glycosyltransferase SunS [Acaryochloris thomasi RCC1774]|uniref:SPBc2 prophage-derived glycosyltransferase SunS n=1 Tax=Acaryochloris thomasi RCC1774 TaxID=1764569 RepID=A0A2W1JLI3_9CYAN|nr:glycosyltransferase family 2 protein [Acaryochloris thomasi]PZD74179.1 SPBc2 prophage-derived glycosyltransferase SunS [Acaryochloris thomasi RCC1774]
MTLSLCMIVKDEERTLSRCLQSVQGVVDQMVVVDTGSCDRTPQIAQSHGAEVYTFAWCDDFAAARNAALQYVTGDWVLVLDADETLVPDIISQLKQAIQQPDVLVINLLRQEVGAKQSPYTLMSRLFRNHPKIKFHCPYHELIDDSVVALQAQEQHWKIGCLEPVAILHEGYTAERIDQQQKTQRAQRIMEQALANEPDDAYLCSKLGALYVENHQLDKGMALLRCGLNLQPPEPAVIYELHYHLGHVYESLGERSKAQEQYQQALAIDLPLLLKIGACNNLANLLQIQGDLEGARQLYTSMIVAQPTLAIAHNNLGLTLRAMGYFGDAIASYQQAICHQPSYAEAHQNLGVALLKIGQIDASQRAFQQAIKLHEDAQNFTEANRLRQTLEGLGLMA